MSERTERLAVNLFDLDRVLPEMRKQMELATRLRHEVITLQRGDGPKEAVLEFTCDLLTAALVLDMLRSECRREGDETIRGYINRGQNWVRLPAKTVLTILDGQGKAHLNHEVFPVEVHPTDLASLRPKPIRL